VIRLGIYDRKRFLQFLIVGGTGFILQFVTVYIVIIFGIKQFIAAMIGGEIAILWNFFANNKWTFNDMQGIHAQGRFLMRLIKFNFASLASIGVQGLVVYIAVKFLGEKMKLFGLTLHTSIAILFPTIILLVIPMNYVIYNRFIWKTHHLKK
jgi:putative flippase GtrA